MCSVKFYVTTKRVLGVVVHCYWSRMTLLSPTSFALGPLII